MTVIDEFLAKLDAPDRTELERIRKIVAATVPDAEEAISYGMPAFKYKGKYLVGFNAWKDHLSLFPASAAIEVFASELSAFKLSKGTIRFTLDNPLPEALIKRIVAYRKDDIEGK